jgi:enolase
MDKIVRITGVQQRLSNWKKFMVVSANKESLIKFLVATWKTSEEVSKLLHHRQLYTTVGHEYECLTSLDGLVA